MAKRAIGTVGLSITLSALVLFATLTVLSEPSEASAAYTPHDPIRIARDADLVVGQNGVVSGSGSSSDPFVISGWRIGLQNAGSGIEVRNTREHVLISGVNITNCAIAVSLSNVSSVSVRDSVFRDNTLGVSVMYSDGVRIAGCTFQNNSYAVSITFSDVSRSGNTYINNGQNLIEKKHPWEEGQIGTMVCIALLIPLIIVISLLVFYRIKHRVRPPPIVQ